MPMGSSAERTNSTNIRRATLLRRKVESILMFTLNQYSDASPT